MWKFEPIFDFLTHAHIHACIVITRTHHTEFTNSKSHTPTSSPVSLTTPPLYRLAPPPLLTTPLSLHQHHAVATTDTRESEDHLYHYQHYWLDLQHQAGAYAVVHLSTTVEYPRTRGLLHVRHDGQHPYLDPIRSGRTHLLLGRTRERREGGG